MLVRAYLCCLSGATDCSWATGFNIPYGVAVDPSGGALFVANSGTNTVCRAPPGRGADDPRARMTGQQGDQQTETEGKGNI